MTIAHLSIGKSDFNMAWCVTIGLLGFCLHAERRFSNGGIFIGVQMQWPKWKSWTLYEWLPTKRTDAASQRTKEE